jgi:hypothetical protein
MSEYWIEIHPEEKQHIVVSDEIINILKTANFPERLDVQIILLDNKITLIFYKSNLEVDKKATFSGNWITGIDFTGISKVYKLPTKIFVTFEQKDTYQRTNLDFDVFVIDFTTNTNEPEQKEEESLDDVFK